MDKEKLEKAAEEYAITYSNNHHALICGFKQGAHWLLSQPLSERLTEEGKEDVMRLFSAARDLARSFHPEDRAIGSAGIDMIENIFGADMFTNQTEE